MNSTLRPFVDYRHVTVRYNEEVTALDDVCLAIAPGEFVVFVGRTGAGKSTMLKLLTKDVEPTSGTVVFDGADLGTITDWHVPKLRRKMGIVPQDFALLPRKKVWENIAYAMRAVGFTRRQIRDRVPEIIERVHIAHRADAFPHELSGGEQQRVAIGRALVATPPLLLADEPTGNLDPEHSLEIMNVLSELNRGGTTVLVASHDFLTLEHVRCRIVRLDHGRIIEDRLPATPKDDGHQFALPIEREPDHAPASHAAVEFEAREDADELEEVSVDV
jgi:cell division transport system ATP-binding protein